MNQAECILTGLRALITSTDYPFPPVLFAYRLGSLVAQTYVSSYPVSALILNDPTTCESLESEPGLVDRLPLSSEDFNFEPKFPLLVVGNLESGKSQKENRLVREGADYVEVSKQGSEFSNDGCPPDIAATLCWLEEMGY